jgi:hypothetical protein
MIKMIFKMSNIISYNQLCPCMDHFNYASIFIFFVHLSLYYSYCQIFFWLVIKSFLINPKCQIKPCLPGPPAEFRKTTNPTHPPSPAPHFPLWFPFNNSCWPILCLSTWAQISSPQATLMPSQWPINDLFSLFVLINVSWLLEIYFYLLAYLRGSDDIVITIFKLLPYGMSIVYRYS